MPVVTVQPGGEVIYLDPDETVLSGLYKAGYAYAVGCRRGGCAICKVDCLSGQFDYDHTSSGVIAHVPTPRHLFDDLVLKVDRSAQDAVDCFGEEDED